MFVHFQWEQKQASCDHCACMVCGNGTPTHHSTVLCSAYFHVVLKVQVY